MSIFITGSNSYLLSGELATNLTGRKIEIEMLPLNFFEQVDMKRFYKKVGKFECDFIVRKGTEDYFYIQVSKNIDDEKTEERDYRPFYEIPDMYPRYLFVFDMILQKNVKGIKNINIADFIYNNMEL